MLSQPFAIPALVLSLLSLPLVLGMVPPNRIYGVRTRRTLSDSGIWYTVNRAAGAAVLLASCVYGGVAVLRPYDRTAADNFATWGIHLAGFVLPLAAGISLALRAAKSR